MSLEETTNQPAQEPAAPIEQPPAAAPAPAVEKPKKGGVATGEKRKQADEIAAQFKDLSWTSAKPEMERVATQKGYSLSRSTLYDAHKRATATKHAATQKETAGQSPSLHVVNEQKKDAGFLKDQPAAGPIEELPNTAATDPAGSSTAAAPIEAAPSIDPEYFRDLLRGVHDCFLSKDGILGDKYGRPKEQVHATSDVLAKYLAKHTSAQQLDNYELPLIVLSYASLVLPILNDIRKERAKKAAEEKKGVRAQ